MTNQTTPTTKTATPMETPNFNQLATLFYNNQNEYYQGSQTALANLSFNLDMILSALEPLTRLNFGNIRQFAKVFRN